MREIKVSDLALKVEEMLLDACENIPCNVLEALRKAKEDEASPLGKEVIEKIIENDILAREKHLPICQDTGVVVCFLEVGYDVHFDGDIYEKDVKIRFVKRIRDERKFDSLEELKQQISIDEKQIRELL